MICSRCKEIVSLEELIIGGTVGNSKSVFCPKCTEEVRPVREELAKRFTKPCAHMQRYISLLTWGIDPAGDMYPAYFDKTLILRRKEM